MTSPFSWTRVHPTLTPTLEGGLARSPAEPWAQTLGSQEPSSSPLLHVEVQTSRGGVQCPVWTP